MTTNTYFNNEWTSDNTFDPDKRIMDLSMNYNCSSRGRLCDKIIYDVLYHECRPIHYADAKLNDCHVLYHETKKSMGPKEAVRQRYGNEKNNAAGIIENTGMIYLKDWKNPTVLKQKPSGKISHPLSTKDYYHSLRDFHKRKKYMYNKGLPDDIRENSFVAEFAATRLLKSYGRDFVLDKLDHSVFCHNDHDFRLVINREKIIKCDFKSLQSSDGTWSAGSKIKDDFIYVFIGPATESDIVLYGHQKGCNLPKDRRIKQSDMIDIYYLLGWLSYKQFLVDNNMIA